MATRNDSLTSRFIRDMVSITKLDELSTATVRVASSKRGREWWVTTNAACAEPGRVAPHLSIRFAWSYADQAWTVRVSNAGAPAFESTVEVAVHAVRTWHKNTIHRLEVDRARAEHRDPDPAYLLS